MLGHIDHTIKQKIVLKITFIHPDAWKWSALDK
jgi:hypothetical protein